VSLQGALGRVCTLWNSQLFKLEYWSRSPNWIQVNLTPLPLGKAFSIFNIYMPSLSHDKIICWRSLLNLQESNTTTSLIFTREFNTTMHASDKWDGNIVRDSTREYMEDLMLGLDLLDIKHVSGCFTWSNKIQGPRHIAARMDRFLISGSPSRGLLPSLVLNPSLGRLNHRPISLELSNYEPLGPIPFRFNPRWEDDPSFLDLVSSTWCSWIQGPRYTFGNKN
jgi:hypothetical protein